MIEIYCGTCERHLVLKFVVRDGEIFVERVDGHSECLCSYTSDDLMDILEDSYRHECPEETPKDMGLIEELLWCLLSCIIIAVSGLTMIGIMWVGHYMIHGRWW